MRAKRAPTPISGGTLLVTRDLRFAVAADPDRDRILVTELANAQTTPIALEDGAEPGRAIEDGEGRVHVALRRGGAIVSIDLTSKTIVKRRALCNAPRGLAWSPERGLLYGVCAGGELFGIGATADTPTVTAQLERDLRDVIVNDGRLLVTQFRRARILRVTLAGWPEDGGIGFTPLGRPDYVFGGGSDPGVAWRTIPLDNNELLVLHQRTVAPDRGVGITAGAYSEGTSTSTNGDAAVPPPRDPCGIGIVHSTIAVGTARGFATGFPAIGRAVLAVDVAATKVFGETRIAIVAAGNGHTPELPQVFVTDLARAADPDAWDCMRPPGQITPKGQAIAAAYRGEELVVQLREPAALVRYDAALREIATIPLGGDSVEDTGHAVFHSNSGGFIACASCHPEGGDDGHVWWFTKLGPRRTQNLRGGIAGTAPFHWDGSQKDLGALMDEVFTKRMSGATLAPDRVAALGKWIDTIPLIPHSPPKDLASVERGRSLFEDTRVACASCHGTITAASFNIGTGSPFQVPSLRGIAFRAPYMHAGCAPTLLDRFNGGGCSGGEKHGHTAHLAREQIADLVAYLETL